MPPFLIATAAVVSVGAPSHQPVLNPSLNLPPPTNILVSVKVSLQKDSLGGHQITQWVRVEPLPPPPRCGTCMLFLIHIKNKYVFLKEGLKF